MFCRQCGSEIPNEAKFCTFCGAKTVAPKSQTDEVSNTSEVNESIDAQNAAEIDQEAETAPLLKDSQAETNSNTAEESTDIGETQDASTESIQTDASDATASSETSNLKAAVAQNKKRSRRRMPMILLVALALALATSVAYAAYRVYTDVWLPYQAEQEMQAKKASSTTGSDGDEITNKTTGEPENLLQIADIMTMDPLKIGEYISSQGVEPQRMAASEYPEDGGFQSNSQFDAWVLAQDETNSQITHLDENDKYLNPDYYDQSYLSIPPVLAMGNAAVPFSGISKSYFTANDLSAGKKPTSITLTTLSMNSLSSDKFDEFLSYCGFGNPMAQATAKKNGAPITLAKCGVIEGEEGQKYLWYALCRTSEPNAITQCTLGCMDIDTAYSTLGISACASASSSDPKGYWSGSNNETKSRLVAKSILEHEFSSGYSGISIEEN